MLSVVLFIIGAQYCMNVVFVVHLIIGVQYCMNVVCGSLDFTILYTYNQENYRQYSCNIVHLLSSELQRQHSYNIVHQKSREPQTTFIQYCTPIIRRTTDNIHAILYTYYQVNYKVNIHTILYTNNQENHRQHSYNIGMLSL
jgi:hypothetical protein